MGLSYWIRPVKLNLNQPQPQPCKELCASLKDNLKLNLVASSPKTDDDDDDDDDNGNTGAGEDDIFFSLIAFSHKLLTFLISAYIKQ
ncbi:hypothetical protein RclHR1_12830002 [Rhizophagus clarus]|uniref:Uncharacterized protein n=1 Tax=Rhizophagus clarus TaxID=94130 RepID=A0A2Z6QNT6_9GLOM|nr:hypothetical protein RclHR1_12830002 [Rhizophagus clarus]